MNQNISQRVEEFVELFGVMRNHRTHINNDRWVRNALTLTDQEAYERGRKERNEEIFKEIRHALMCHHSYYERSRSFDMGIEKAIEEIKEILLPDEPFKSWEDAI